MYKEQLEPLVILETQVTQAILVFQERLVPQESQERLVPQESQERLDPQVSQVPQGLWESRVRQAL